MSKQAGILLAAGLSSRMGILKAALPFAGQTVLARQIDALTMAGCDPIILVTGYEAARVASLSQKKIDTGNKEGRTEREVRPAVRICHNPDYARGMFTSIQKGVSAVPDEALGFVILPVDCVRIPPRIIARVISAGTAVANQIILPSFGKEAGHPPWFPISWKKKITEGEGPLDVSIKSALEKGQAKYEPVDSESILWDMDTREDYERMLFYESSLPEDTWTDLLRQQALPERTVAHGKSVGELAAKWAGEINHKQPGRMDERLAYAGGLLHDMAKKWPDHEHKGAEILRWHGYDRLADIVEAHMGLPGWDEETITEKELVYAADKEVRETEYVGVVERYKPAKEKCGDNPKVLRKIEAGEKKALRVMGKIEGLLRG